ncbi:MAG TPA: 3-oxoadipate enol-lactonase [Actinomycetes bacterium]|nr:3-oxoadipate enol-lactonase [Actinomycetes bacterium]
MAAVPVHYLVDGPADAPPLLLSSSLGATADMWEPQAAALADRFRIVRYDHRGHGRSPVPPGPYELADLGADAQALLDRLEIDKAHLAGLSLGGMVAMWLAAHAPDRVDRLVLMSTSAKLGPPQAWAERAATVRAAGSTGAVADAVVGRWFTAGYASAHPNLVRRFRDMIAATPPDGYAACCGAIERMDLEPGLARIRAATLVISGTDDPATPPVHAERIAAGIAGATLELLPGAAHLANVSAADTVNELLAAFLTPLTGSAGSAD